MNEIVLKSMNLIEMYWRGKSGDVFYTFIQSRINIYDKFGEFL